MLVSIIYSLKLLYKNYTQKKSNHNKNWIKYGEDYSHLVKVYDGIERNLIRLKGAGIYTGIVTSRTLVELENDFFPFGLQKYMRAITSADDTEKHKPEPEPLLEFLKISKVSPSSTLYIGDTIYDMKCANSAGIDFALALWGAKSSGGITDAKYVLKSPDEIWDVIKN